MSARSVARRAARKLGVGPDPDRHRSAEDRRALERIRAGVDLPRRLPRRRRPGSVWAVTMVRDEEDVIGRSVGHLVRQGVSHVVLSDNGSTDLTVATALAAADAGRLTIAHDPVREYYQALKMTHLSRYAWRGGADWVLPFDADELWFAADATLGTELARSTRQVLEADVHNAFPSTEHGWVLDTTPHPQTKVCFRSDPDAVLTVGNHDVHHPHGRPRDAPRLKVLHVPWRSPEQLARKLTQGGQALVGTGVGSAIGAHWTRFAGIGPETAQSMWDTIAAGDAVEGLSWNPVGTLVPLDLDTATGCGSWAELERTALR